MNFKKVAVFTAVLALAACGSAWAQDPCNNVPNLVFCHTFDQTGNAFSSQNDTNGNGNFATVYDNFRFFIGEDITSWHWVGEYFNPPEQGPITAWTLQVRADVGGQPGDVLFQVNAAAGCPQSGGSVCETFLGNINGFPIYRYDLGDTAAFHANADFNYWLDVIPDLGFPPQWGWSSASNTFGPCDFCDSISYQDFFGDRSVLDADMAFALNSGGGGGVPEPGTLVMLGTGVLGLAGAIRRKLV